MNTCPRRAPSRNVYIDRIPRGAPIKLCGRPGTRYYVAKLKGGNAVVHWEGRFSHEAQARLDAAVRRGRW